VEVETTTGQLKGVPSDLKGIVGGEGTQYIDGTNIDKNLSIQVLDSKTSYLFIIRSAKN
jgi:hypothetical protein